MPTKQQIIDALPSIKNNSELVVEIQGEKDLIREILKSHNEFARDYDRIYRYFLRDTVRDTAKEIYTFLKKNFKYTAEDEGDQTVKTPGRILTPGEKIDCKHYSLFTGGILDAITRNTSDQIFWTYRFASYNWENIAAHVFVVVWDENGSEIWIDPVLDHFDEKKYPTYQKDKKPVAMNSINGHHNRNDRHGRNNRQQSSGLGKSLFITLGVLSILALVTKNR